MAKPASLARTTGSALVLCIALFTAWNSVYAQSAEDTNHARWGVTLDWIELELDEDELVAAEFNRYEAKLGVLIDDAEQSKVRVFEALETPRLELDALGSPPEKGEPPEAKDISVQRNAINEEITALTQREKHAELIIVRAEQLLERLKDCDSVAHAIKTSYQLMDRRSERTN